MCGVGGCRCGEYGVIISVVNVVYGNDFLNNSDTRFDRYGSSSPFSTGRKKYI